MHSLIPATSVIAATSFAKAPSKAVTKAGLLLFSIAVLLMGSTAALRGQSALDGFDPKANGSVRSIVVQPDGKILIGGNFTMLSPNGGTPVMRNYIARLNPDGTLDTAFNPNANGNVFSIALQADGKILVGGYFSGMDSIGGVTGKTRNRIARLYANGTLDVGLPFGGAPAFNPNASDGVLSIAVQSDRKILVGGFFHGPNSIGNSSETRDYIARLNPDGTLDPAFIPNANGAVLSIVAQPGGRILVGGLFSGSNSIGGQTRNYIARLIGATGLADGFKPDANLPVRAIAVQADGMILAGGNFHSIGGQTRDYIARLNPFGGNPGRADSFAPNANGEVDTIAVQADGKILVGGLFTTIGTATRRYIARLDATTNGLADSFNPNANSFVRAIAVQADGKVLAGGEFTALEPTNGAVAAVTRNFIARLETDGRLDQTLNPIIAPADIYVTSIAVQPDGKILISGNFDTVSGVARNNMVRLNIDGTVDMAFNPDSQNSVESIVVQPEGNLLVGGTFYYIGGRERYHMARLNGTSGLADGFNPRVSDIVYAIAVQPDGMILIGGDFLKVTPNGVLPGMSRNRIARLFPDGTLDLPFNPDANGRVNSIVVQNVVAFLVGGSFHGLNSIGGNSMMTPNYFAQLFETSPGTLTGLNPNPNSSVYAIAVQADGMILAGGDFTRFTPNPILGQPKDRNRIARLDPNFARADTFDPNADDFIGSIAVQADGKVLVGGGFTKLRPNGAVFPTIRTRIARLNTDGTLDAPFNPNTDRFLTSVVLQADGKVLVGGAFTTMGGQPRTLFARLSNNTAALQNLAVTQTTITWTRGGSSPELMRATFEQSLNGGATYTFLGEGARVGRTSNFNLTGLHLPTDQNFWIRARGYHHSSARNSSVSIAESVRNAYIPGTSVNIAIETSTRFRVTGPLLDQTGGDVGIGGFIITGSEPKHVLIRAIGPSLGQFGVPDALADPVLELHGPDTFATITNNDWRETQETEIQSTGIPPSNDLESAIDVTLDPGAYTAIVAGNGNTSGVALVEVYDLDQAVDSKLANLSTRAFVGTGDDIVIAGFVLGGNSGSDRVIIRGIGPSLAALGVPNALANPTLDLRDSNGALLVVNNDWQDNPEQAAELTASGLAPANNLESGIAATLPPGLYTALLAGSNSGTGVGLVEVYDLGAP